LGLDAAQDFSSTLCPTLTIKQRAIGFATCLAIGFLLDLFSFARLAQVFTGHAERYALIYTAGNLTALSGTFFLAGPSRQLARMTTQHRWMASLAFVVSMVLTLIVASVGYFRMKGLIILLLVLIQWVALIWYGLSFIPFGRQMARAVIQRICCGGGSA